MSQFPEVVTDAPAVRYEGRRVLVTGGSRGIGRAIATRLTAHGADVTIIGRDRETLSEAVRAGVARAAMAGDLARADERAALLRDLAEVPAFDDLVLNAGAAETAPYHRTDRDLLERMMEINFFAVAAFIHALTPKMVARKRGRIVVIASTAALKGYRYTSAYSAAKHALLGYVRSVALEIARSGVTLNAVCPGFTDTPLVQNSLAEVASRTGRSPAETLLDFVQHNPQGRLVSPDEVAATVLWLLSPGAGAIHGQAISVSGGEV